MNNSSDILVVVLGVIVFGVVCAASIKIVEALAWAVEFIFKKVGLIHER